MTNDKEGNVSATEAQCPRDNEGTKQREDLGGSQSGLEAARKGETGEKKDAVTDSHLLTSSSIVWGGADGADLYLLEDEERHLRQRQLNRVFKDKIIAYKAAKAQKGGLSGSSSSPSPVSALTASKGAERRTALDSVEEKKEEGLGSSRNARTPSKVASSENGDPPATSGAPRNSLSFVEHSKTAGETRAEPVVKSAASESADAKPEEQSISELYIHMESFPKETSTSRDKPAETPGVAAAAATDAPWFDPPLPSLAERTGGDLRRGIQGDRFLQPPSFYVSMHKEICSLLKLIQPTKVEEYKTLKALARLEVAASLCFPGCSCRCFGSFATNMMLPGGDVDVCILLPSAVKSVSSSPSGSCSQSPARSPARTYSSESEPRSSSVSQKAENSRPEKKRGREGTGTGQTSPTPTPEAAQAHAENVAHLTLLTCVLQQLGVAHGLELVSTARVPIIKYIDAATGVPLDVTINQPSSLDTTVFVQQMLRKFPLLRPLLLLAKLFLRLRNLSETYRGGAGSYLLFTMALLFLKTWQPSHDETVQREVLLSHLFIDFLFFWGKHWHYRDWGGCVRGLGHSFLKNVRPELWGGDRRELLCMESPTTPEVDLGKNAFNILNVRSAFQAAFLDLMALHLEWSDAEMQWKHDMERSQSRRGAEGRQPAIPQVYSRSILAHLFDPSHPVFSVREREKREDGAKWKRSDSPSGMSKEESEQQKHEELIRALGLRSNSPVHRSNSSKRVILCARPSSANDGDDYDNRSSRRRDVQRSGRENSREGYSGNSPTFERGVSRNSGYLTPKNEDDSRKKHEGWVEIGVPVELLEEAVADFLLVSTTWRKPSSGEQMLSSPGRCDVSGEDESEESSSRRNNEEALRVQSRGAARKLGQEERPGEKKRGREPESISRREQRTEENKEEKETRQGSTNETPSNQANGCEELAKGEDKSPCLEKSEHRDLVCKGNGTIGSDVDDETLVCLYAKLRRTVKGKKDTSYTAFVARLAAATAV
ncbi:polynucleotide adenylyltransferase [Cystoisospora suis]|uniref:Polynucleotide adenylyltransferase n=1 Tax=Cystoisospora suis TaxID=483139 RepID=A0A2C6KPZ6_9APIC|nr:polynucleotide adenylyltransferase [Cystoisospora suis]